MMKHLYLLFILLVPVSGYSQKSIEYIEQYVEIINNISQDLFIQSILTTNLLFILRLIPIPS